MSSHQKNSTRFLRWNKKAFCPSKKQYGPGYLGANRFRENKKAPLWRFFLSVFFSCIFIFRSHSTPDVPLLFIGIHQLFDLPVKLWVYFFQPLRYIFMFRRDELELFHPSPNPQATAGKYLHSRPCPLRFSG